MHFSDYLKEEDYKLITEIKSMKDLIIYVESERINFEDILFEGSLFDYSTPYEIAEVKRHNNFLFVITNAYGILAKQNILPDGYRDMIFDNKILYTLLHLFNDCSIKLIFYSTYMKYCNTYKDKIVRSLLRDDLNISIDYLINGALAIINPLVTFNKIAYLIRSFFIHDFILNIEIENRDLIFTPREDQKTLEDTIIGYETLGSILYTSRNLKISVTTSSVNFEKVLISIKNLKQELSYFAYSYKFVLETKFIDIEKMNPKINEVLISYSSVLSMEKIDNSVLVYF